MVVARLAPPFPPLCLGGGGELFTISSSWGNGHATLWRGLCKALARRGHEVVFFERDVPYYALNRDLVELPDGELCLYPSWDGRAAARALASRRCRRGDGHLLLPGRRPRPIWCSTRAVPVRAFYDLDTPVTLARLEAGEAVEYIGPRGLGEFDLVLSYTGGRALAELQAALAPAGSRRSTAASIRTCLSAHRGAAQYRADLSYMGTYAADRQPALEQLLVEPARRLPERRFPDRRRPVSRGLPLDRQHLLRAPSAAGEHPGVLQLVAADPERHARGHGAMGYCPSGRLFEAAACGAPILSDAWEGLDAFFRPDPEILVAHDTEDAIGALETPDAELARIASRAGSARSRSTRRTGGPRS